MKPRVFYRTLAAAFVLAGTVFVPFVKPQWFQGRPFVFEVTLRSSVSGYAQVYYDTGKGFSEADSRRIPVRGGETAICRFRLPAAHYRALRFDPIDREAHVSFSGARILDPDGDVVRIYAPSQFQPVQQIQAFKTEWQSAEMATTGEDPILLISLPAPLALRTGWQPLLARNTLRFCLVWVFCAALVHLVQGFYVRRRDQVDAVWGDMLNWINGHPKRALAITAVTAVVVSCYPVVFFDRSFVSPNHGTVLLYDTFPTLPGYTDTSMEDVKGSDIGATMWEDIPYSVIQHRAIFRDFELPLWNRYNSSGVPLLGQGISMLGDPLHVLPVLADGAAWAWDLKFLLAKILFAYGVGLTLYGVTRHLPSALILTLSSAFLGFFSFRLNHPAFFSMCYAPWILYCWLSFAAAITNRAAVGWIAVLTFVNWAGLHSGTVKEAYMLSLCLNLCGLALVLFSKAPMRVKLTRARQLAFGALLFALISSPSWLTFLDVLRKSSTAYDLPHAWQIQPSLFIGLFDDIFYRQFNAGENHFNPAANFLVLLGFLWSLTHLRTLLQDRIYVALLASALIPFSLAFGIVPPSAIVRVPFLGNVAHVDDTFSVVLIIELMVLAGFGIKACWDRVKDREWSKDYVLTVLMLLALLGLYLGSTQAAQRTSITFLSLGQEIPKSGFFLCYGFLLVCAFVAVPLLLRRVALRRPETSIAVLLLVACLLIMHFRHGMHLSAWFDPYVMNPQARVDLRAKSPAVEFVKSSMVEPFRVVGFGANLFPGYHGVYGVESVYGADPLVSPYYWALVDAFRVERVWNWRLVIQGDTVAGLKPLYDLLNVKYYLGAQREGSRTLTGLNRVGSFDLNVYQSSSAWPRAFFTDTLSQYQSVADFAGMVKTGDGRPFAAVESGELRRDQRLGSLLRDQGQRRAVGGADYKLTNNTTSFKIVAPSAGMIVLTEGYLEGDFRASVNGEPARCVRVNHAFKGVVIEKPGTYTVRFTYWPRYFTWCLWMWALGVVSLCAWLARVWRLELKETSGTS